jgi:hypothetical protein
VPLSFAEVSAAGKPQTSTMASGGHSLRALIRTQTTEEVWPQYSYLSTKGGQLAVKTVLGGRSISTAAMCIRWHKDIKKTQNNYMMCPLVKIHNMEEIQM